MRSKILLVYTGGTIGMMKDAATGALKSFDFNKLLHHIPEIKQIHCDIDTLSFNNPVDSSDMDVSQWLELGEILYSNYADYDGFVVLHGSDTMAYTASVMSFMFENLNKPIIFTGSQLPIGDLRTDAKENLITSIHLATIQQNDVSTIQEVCIYFEYQLYRANRTSKLNAEHFEAFSSPNYPPLAISGVHLNVNKHLLWNNDDNFAFAKAKSNKLTPSSKTLSYRSNLVPNVTILRIFPGITKDTVVAICNTPNLKGLILETYGSGNAPTYSWFLDEIKRLVDNQVAVVNVTQCKGGAVQMGKYETSVTLKEIGVVSGEDITIEAALAKMMYLLSYQLKPEVFKSYFETSLRGELTQGFIA